MTDKSRNPVIIMPTSILSILVCLQSLLETDNFSNIHIYKVCGPKGLPGRTPHRGGGGRGSWEEMVFDEPKSFFDLFMIYMYVKGLYDIQTIKK